ncbi:MAG: thioredoxin [Clostridia bacterium]|nr:thioredoxin [Clostridia bacterium]
MRQLLFALSLILILSGILNGSARDVLIKAITICSECIGLG